MVMKNLEWKSGNLGNLLAHRELLGNGIELGECLSLRNIISVNM